MLIGAGTAPSRNLAAGEIPLVLRPTKDRRPSGRHRPPQAGGSRMAAGSGARRPALPLAQYRHYRVAGQRPPNHDTLLLAAAQLLRPVTEPLPKPQLAKQSGRAPRTPRIRSGSEALSSTVSSGRSQCCWTTNPTCRLRKGVAFGVAIFSRPARHRALVAPLRPGCSADAWTHPRPTPLRLGIFKWPFFASKVCLSGSQSAHGSAPTFGTGCPAVACPG